MTKTLARDHDAPYLLVVADGVSSCVSWHASGRAWHHAHNELPFFAPCDPLRVMGLIYERVRFACLAASLLSACSSGSSGSSSDAGGAPMLPSGCASLDTCNPPECISGKPPECTGSWVICDGYPASPIQYPSTVNATDPLLPGYYFWSDGDDGGTTGHTGGTSWCSIPSNNGRD